MFEFVKQTSVSALMFFSRNLSKVISLKCVSMINQECKTRPEIINIDRNKLSFYPYSFRINKCSGWCSNINDPFPKLYVPGVVKNENLKVFDLTSRTNETRYNKLHETCKYKCRFNQRVCNNKKRLNQNKCRCEFKELIDKGICEKGFIWNPSNCKCECN